PRAERAAQPRLRRRHPRVSRTPSRDPGTRRRGRHAARGDIAHRAVTRGATRTRDVSTRGMASRAGKAQTIVTHARSVARIVVRAGLLILRTFSMSGPAVAAEGALPVGAPRTRAPTAGRIRALGVAR